jgi:co-chaperonin GroES (HSP10)
VVAPKFVPVGNRLIVRYREPPPIESVRAIRLPVPGDHAVSGVVVAVGSGPWNRSTPFRLGDTVVFIRETGVIMAGCIEESVSVPGVTHYMLHENDVIAVANTGETS